MGRTLKGCNTMIDTFVTFHVLPGKTAEFERLHQQLLARISAQPRCATIRVHRSVTNPLEYMVHGTWLTEAWERAHQTMPEFKSLFNSLPIEHHSLSRASFFEPAYECAGASIEP
jgi:quinol monooxygenase YgiN